MTTKFQIAVLDRGFVYVGRCTLAENALTIQDAQCIRRWGTSNGLGELATKGPTSKTVLDKSTTVTAPVASVMHLIDCDTAAWEKTFGTAAA